MTKETPLTVARRKVAVAHLVDGTKNRNNNELEGVVCAVRHSVTREVWCTFGEWASGLLVEPFG